MVLSSPVFYLYTLNQNNMKALGLTIALLLFLALCSIVGCGNPVQGFKTVILIAVVGIITFIGALIIGAFGSK